MSIRTKVDKELQYELDHESWKDDAREEYYNECRKIYLAHQHLIDDDCKLDVNDCLKVSKAIQDIIDLSVDYIYTTDDDGEFSYDFTTEGVHILRDELAYEWEAIF